MTIKPQDPKDLGELIKRTFCNLTTIKGCNYINEVWCPETCNWYKEKIREAKYRTYKTPEEMGITRVLDFVKDLGADWYANYLKRK